MSKVFLSFFERTYSLRESNFIKNSFLKASEVFESYGYDYVCLPLFEKHEEQDKSIGESARESLSFRDTLSGELISLRRDLTTLAVRTVSSFGELKFPRRVFYFGKVVSIKEEGYESYQAGIELMGVKSLEGDAEVIFAINDYIKSLGLRDFSISVSHVGITQRVLESVEEGCREEVKCALENKDISYLKAKFGNSFTAELPLFQGGEDVLKVLEERGFVEEAQELKRLGYYLKEADINFIYDLGEVRKLPYYTGVVFEVFHEKSGFPIASGGRYDSLSNIFGKNFPSTGGAVYLSRIYGLTDTKVQGKDFFIIDMSKDKSLGYKLASFLRESGYKTGRDMVNRGIEHSLKYAFSEGFRRVIAIYDDADIRIYSSVKDFEVISLKEFLNAFKKS